MFQNLSLFQLRLLWQKHLLKLMEIEFPARQYVIITLWANYPDGFYANLGNGRKNRVLSKSYRGLIPYLTNYLSSPPIGLFRIVRYYYQLHKMKLKTDET